MLSWAPMTSKKTMFYHVLSNKTLTWNLLQGEVPMAKLTHICLGDLLGWLGGCNYVPYSFMALIYNKPAGPHLVTMLMCLWIPMIAPAYRFPRGSHGQFWARTRGNNGLVDAPHPDEIMFVNVGHHPILTDGSYNNIIWLTANTS